MPDANARAVVIGGSLTGLVATRVLADHFGEVVLVERDRFPDGPAARKVIPQARHIHVLLKEGERILAQYFPGICEQLLRGGAFRIDMAADTRWRHFGGWKVRFRSGMDMLSQSRPLLEWTVRGRVVALPNVHVLDGHDAAGLAVGGGAVRGPRGAPRGGARARAPAPAACAWPGAGAGTRR